MERELAVFVRARVGIVSVFEQTASSGSGALLRDWTRKSCAGRGEARELVPRMRNRTGAGEGLGCIGWVLRGVKARVLGASASEGSLLSLPSFRPPTLHSFSSPTPAKSRRRGPLPQPRLLEFRPRPPPLPSEASESETSRVCGHPASPD